ncbi:MAG: ferric reductase-like transmembrane domain-containing protein [Gammaproteobacteria bacterium]|nr:ferric reductase-like transmembrane domain-containing protein [Gammaproteobacteria bacterium]
MRVIKAGDRIEYSRLEQRWFASLLLYTAAPIAAVVVYRIPRGIDFWWDTLMAVGVMAGAGLALLPLLSARWWVRQHRETPFLRLIQAVHRHVSYVALALVAVHIAGLVVLEERVIEYLKLSASAPMLAGLVASVLFLGLILTSKFREQLAWTYRGWRNWHAALSLMAVACMTWHFLGAGYYFSGVGKQGALIWLVAFPTLLSLLFRYRALPAMSTESIAVASTHAAIDGRSRRLAMAVALTWLAASMLYGGLQAIVPSPIMDKPCVIEPCL